MKIAVLAKEKMKSEWMQKGTGPQVEILWCGSVRTLVSTTADAYFDLEFENDPERSAVLNQRAPLPVFVNSVEWTGAVIGTTFVRINAWPGFLQRSMMEVAPTAVGQEDMIKAVLSALGWQYRLVPDIPGMISARIIASIINEAYYTVGDQISSREEIDVAMKLGTSYPYGPFDWADKIGIDRIGNLLLEMQKQDDRYEPAPSLKYELELLKAKL